MISLKYKPTEETEETKQKYEKKVININIVI